MYFTILVSDLKATFILFSKMEKYVNNSLVNAILRDRDLVTECRKVYCTPGTGCRQGA